MYSLDLSNVTVISIAYVYRQSLRWSPPTSLRRTCSEPSMSHTQTPPSTIITPDNHGGLITITAAVGMTFALSSMGIRIYARTQINGPWSHDDSALLAAAVRLSSTNSKCRAFVDDLPVFLHLPIHCENDICSKRLRKDYWFDRSRKTAGSSKGSKQALRPFGSAHQKNLY